MSLIGEIIPLSHIELDVEVSSKKRLFEQAGLLLENEAGLPRADVFECLFAREKLGTTGLGQGVAIPHGRDACVQKAVGAFIRTKEPISLMHPMASRFRWCLCYWCRKTLPVSIWKCCRN